MSTWTRAEYPGASTECAHFESDREALDEIAQKLALTKPGQHVSIFRRGVELGGGVDVYLIIEAPE